MLILRWTAFLLYETVWQCALFLIKIGVGGDKAQDWYQKHKLETIRLAQPTDKGSPTSILYFCSSLGEYERVKPILTLISRDSDIAQEICFFSPSGKERVNFTEQSQIKVSYAPFDRNTDVKAFLNARRIVLVIVSSNAIWPNLLKHLSAQNIPYAYVGSSFYGSNFLKNTLNALMTGYLKKAAFISVIDDDTKQYLNKLGITNNIAVTGDPRVDSIISASQKTKSTEVSKWSEGREIFIFGSTHDKDELMIKNIIPKLLEKGLKIVICPHDINLQKLDNLKSLFPESALYSDLKKFPNSSICIINRYGILKELYKDTHYAYVGGGFGKGIHNLLEPLVEKNQVSIGPRYHKFPEARYLVAKGAIGVIHKEQDLLDACSQSDNTESDKIAESYINTQKDATKRVLDLIKTLDVY